MGIRVIEIQLVQENKRLQAKVDQLTKENEMLTIDKNLLIKMLKNPEQFIDGMYLM